MLACVYACVVTNVFVSLVTFNDTLIDVYVFSPHNFFDLLQVKQYVQTHYISDAISVTSKDRNWRNDSCVICDSENDDITR